MRKLILVGLFAVVQTFATTVYWREGFENDPPGLNSVTLTNWDVTPSIDIVGNDLWGISTCHSGERCIDMDGTGLDPAGSISRSFSVFRTGNHLLEWYNSGSQRNYPATQFSSMLVSITDGVNSRSTVVQLRWNHPWTAHAMPFNVTNINQVVVTFQGLTGFDVGLLVDDIQFIDPRNGVIGPPPETTHMPEPTSMAMLGLGLVVVGIYRRK